MKHDTEELMDIRTSVLKEAERIISGHRDLEYGGPEDSFRAIATLWTDYLDYEMTEVDVAMMMVLLKIARIKTGGSKKIDNFVDIAGYAACGAEVSV